MGLPIVGIFVAPTVTKEVMSPSSTEVYSYPLILSLEIHCDTSNQQEIARLLAAIFEGHSLFMIW